MPFVGAGISIPFGFPGWTQFLAILAKEAGIEDQVATRIKGGQYEEAIDDVIYAFGMETARRRGIVNPRNPDILADGTAILNGHLTRTFGLQRTKSLRPRGAARLLPKLSQGLVVTTNFDRVVERAYEVVISVLPWRRFSGFRDRLWGLQIRLIEKALRERGTVLLKIHGDVTDPDQRVLSLTEYITHYGGVRSPHIDWTLPLPKALESLFRSSTVLFLGCSLKNDRTLEAVKQIFSRHNGMMDHFAVLEWPLEDEYDRTLASLAQAGIHPIWYPRGRHEQIAEILRRILSPLPRLFYASAAVVVLAVLGLLYAMMQASRNPSIQHADSKIEAILVRRTVGHALSVEVSYQYNANTPPSKIRIQAYGPADKNGSRQLINLEGLFDVAEEHRTSTIIRGVTRDWIFSPEVLSVGAIRAALVAEHKRSGRSGAELDPLVLSEIGDDKTLELMPLGNLSGQSELEVEKAVRSSSGEWTVTIKWLYAWEMGPQNLILRSQLFERSQINSKDKVSTAVFTKETSLPTSITSEGSLTVSLQEPNGLNAEPTGGNATPFVCTLRLITPEGRQLAAIDADSGN